MNCPDIEHDSAELEELRREAKVCHCENLSRLTAEQSGVLAVTCAMCDCGYYTTSGQHLACLLLKQLEATQDVMEYHKLKQTLFIVLDCGRKARTESGG
jgi:hypothetical protein